MVEPNGLWFLSVILAGFLTLLFMTILISPNWPRLYRFAWGLLGIEVENKSQSEQESEDAER